jgi:hypothetical protein
MVAGNGVSVVTPLPRSPTDWVKATMYLFLNAGSPEVLTRQRLPLTLISIRLCPHSSV